MAAASSLRNTGLSLLRQRLARGARQMSTNGAGSRAGKTGGGGGPATGGAANSGVARMTGSGSTATGGGGGASNSGGVGVSGGGVGASTGGGGGAATGGASNSGRRGTGGRAVANSGGGGAANSGSGGGATGVDRLRKDIFKETRRLWDGYNMLSEADRKQFEEIARLVMDNSMNRVNAKADLVSTTYKFLGSAAAFIIAGVSCLGPYIRDSVVHDTANQVDERLCKLQGQEGGDKTAIPGDATPTINVHTKPAAAAPTGGSVSAAAAPGAPATVDVKKRGTGGSVSSAAAAGSQATVDLKKRCAPATVDLKKKGAAAPAAGSASVDK